LNFYLGGLNTFGYHLVNVVIHIINGWLIFWLVLKTLSLSRSGISKLGQDYKNYYEFKTDDRFAWKIAFSVTLIWLIHPVQIQAVTYIVQRLASLSALLCLCSFSLYLSGRLRSDQKKYLFYVLSIFAGLLALGVKQTAVVLPFLIFPYELFFFHESPWKALKKRWWVLVLLGVFLSIMTVVYLGPNFWETLQQSYAQWDFTMWQRLITEARVIIHYISLIALPLPSRLNVDYDFTVSTSLFEPFTTWLSVVAIFTILVYAIVIAHRQPLLSFAILWFFGNLVIESTIIPLDLVYEHRLYLASLGPIAAMTLFVYQKLIVRHKSMGPIVLLIVAIPLAFWTFQRNQLWADPIKIWTDNVKKSPGKARVYANLGEVLGSEGRYEEAAEAFERAIQLAPNYFIAYNNLAVIYLHHQKKYNKAKALLHRALELKPDYPTGYLNLSAVAQRQGNYNEAMRALKKALELDPTNLEAHYNLALYYKRFGDFSKAMEILNRGISYWPAAHLLYLLKGRIYLEINQPTKADAAFRKANVLRPDDPKYVITIRRLNKIWIIY